MVTHARIGFLIFIASDRSAQKVKCSKYGEDRSINHATILSIDAGRIDGRTPVK